MKIRGMLKNAAIGAGIMAVPGLATADTIDDVQTNITGSAGTANTASVTIELVASVGGTMTLEVRPRGNTPSTILTADPTGVGTHSGFVNFGQISSGGVAPDTGSVVTMTGGGASYIAELEAEITYTGLSSVDLQIRGSAPTDTGGSTTNGPAARWGCATDAVPGTWQSTTGGNTLGAATTCANWTTSEVVVPVDLVFSVTPTTAPETWQTDYIFTAIPTVVSTGS